MEAMEETPVKHDGKNLNADQRAGDAMNFLYRTTIRLSEQKPLEELLDDVVVSSRDVLDAEQSSLALFDEKDAHLHFHIATGEKGSSIKAHSLALGVGIAGWVAEHRRSLLLEDCYDDPRFNREFDKMLSFRTRSMICAPMLYKDKLIGILQTMNKRGGHVFSNSDLEVLEILAAQCATSIENARLMRVEAEQVAIRKELSIAREIQKILLPTSFSLPAGVDMAVELIPAKQVAGDYYNIHRIDEENTLLLVCDVSGKSVSAALIVSTISAAIRTYGEIHRGAFVLTDLVSSLNRVLIDSTTSEKFVTAWFGLFNHRTMELESLNAGHNTIFLQRSDDGRISELSRGGFVLGSLELPFESERLVLSKGDMVLWYTDGVPEAFSPTGEFYGEERMRECLSKSKELSAAQTVHNLLDDLKRFTLGMDQSDDITCGVMKLY